MLHIVKLKQFGRNLDDKFFTSISVDFSFVSAILNLQLPLISFELARNRDPRQSWMMLVLRIVHPSQKNVEPRCLQFARSEEDRVWKLNNAAETNLAMR